ncbi:MAG: hypothetical protein HOW73_26355 [Polyangiaceae bacterium]|nr:hypothetical protein [Polyangiaceae bacterium]
MSKTWSRTVVVAWLGLQGALGATGCSATNVRATAPVPRDTEDETTPRHGARVGDVEVLLDSKPERPFVVVRELSTKTSNNPSSIEAMRRHAAEAGLDGIYWIDCSSPCSGRCSAKAYVYVDRIDLASR